MRSIAGEPVRRQILGHLKRAGAATLDELERVLGLRRSTLRQQLVQLAIEGKVVQRSQPRGVGRPRALYTPGPAADEEFPKRHEEMLRAALETVRRDGGPKGIERLCDGMLKRIVEEHRHVRSVQDPVRRLRAVLDVLVDRGEVFEFEREEQSVALRFYDCPFGDLPAAFPELCDLARGVVEKLGGLPVHLEEWQVKGDRRCVFRVRLGPGTAGPQQRGPGRRDGARARTR